jgi:hypothetical protein
MQQRYFLVKYFLFLLLPFAAWAQGAGDLAFTGFDADGNDNFAIVTFVDIPANTTIYFADKGWTGSAFATTEGTLTWNTGETVISAGTVIGFYNVSTFASSNATSGSIKATNLALGASGEGLWMYLGDSPTAPTRFLAAIGTAAPATAFGTLDNTGLVVGTTAIILTTDVDVAAYKGPRTGLNLSGYIAALNNIASNWLTQDGSGNQNTDGTPPDIPFDLSRFVISAGDNTPPRVSTVSIRNLRQWEVRFTEGVKLETGTNGALNPENYRVQPALRIDSLVYSTTAQSLSIFHEGMSNGVDYSLAVRNISDLAGNIMTDTFTSGRLVFNTTTPQLRITEIMYNPPSGADSLEFIEIYNSGSGTVLLGGLELRDQTPTSGAFGQIAFVFPSTTLEPGGIVLAAPQGNGANNFFAKTFYNLATPSNALNNGGEALVLRNSLGQVLDSVNYDDVSPWPTAPDGGGPSLERKRVDISGNEGSNWRPSSLPAGQVGSAVVLASPGTFSPVLNASVAFESNIGIFTEGTLNTEINLVVDQAPTQDLRVQVEAIDFTARRGEHVLLLADTVSFPKGQAGGKTLAINFPENTQAGPDRYFGLRVKEVRDGVVGVISEMMVYVKDNDQSTLLPKEELSLVYAGSFSIRQGASAEMAAYDPAAKRLYVANGLQNKLEILSFNGTGAVALLKSVDLSTYGISIQRVATRNGILAAAVQGANFGSGRVVFFNKDGDFLAQVQVGVLPDYLIFTPDGKRIVTANEGEPAADYGVDPPGSISIITLPENIADIQQSSVQTLDFSAYDGQKAQLQAAGVRIFGPNASVSQDLEPESVTVLPDGRTAYVTLQENNALAVVDLVTPKISAILPLGYKDHMLPGNALDISDLGDQVLMANYPVLGVYSPDGISHFSVGGKQYLLTANEGSPRSYSGLVEEVRFGFVEFPLDSSAFPNRSLLKLSSGVGRLNVSSKFGDTDGDGDYDKAYSFGGRSFGIWDEQGKLVYESGDIFERAIAADPVYGAIFNAGNTNVRAKDRSDNLGPEPEEVVAAQINGKTYAMISLKRVGGVIVFNVTNPQAPYFVRYANNRSISSNTGDRGPEGILFISAEDSPNDTAMIVLANEISGSLTFYAFPQSVTPVRQISAPVNTLKVFPNPVSGWVFLEQEGNYRIFDYTGRLVGQVQATNRIDLSRLPAGTYFLLNDAGDKAHVVKQ